VALAIDRAPHDPREAAFARVATALGKYWVCRRCAPFVNEAQECLGGAGYVEESILPRLYRQAPLNSIWEGSGNVQCLDVLRALRGDAREALLDELNTPRGQHPAYDAALRTLPLAADQAEARVLSERLALLLSASLLLRSAPAELSALFCASRLGGAHGLAFGTLPADVAFPPLLERAFPAR
jgi:putative acyl-CoA dehydrogenase